MKTLAVIILSTLILTGCAAAVDRITMVENLGDGISRFEDPDYNVVCWIFLGPSKGGISCLPKDQQTKN